MSQRAEGTTAGERLLRSEVVDRAAGQVAREVAAQVAGALAGPVGTALAGTVTVSQLPGDHGDAPARAQALLSAALPRMFIGVGAALTMAYGAVSAGDEVQAAGALRCAQNLLFPADPLGLAAVAGAARPALEGLVEATPAASAPETEDAAAAMRRRVAAEVDDLEHAFLRVAPHLNAAALGAYSWKKATGGLGPGSDVLRGQLGPFLNGLVRWTFLVEAALDGVRRDDWARAGAALVAARRVTAS